MPKVKKYIKSGPLYQYSGEYIILSFGVALAEILWRNYHPNLTKENEEIVRQQLLTGYMVETVTATYCVINPIKDLINNIDDYVNLDDYEE